MYVAIVRVWATVRRRSGLCSHNEPYVSKHRCVWIVDICVIKWGEEKHKSSSEMSPLEMQDGLNAIALINIIVISLMMYHGTEMVATNPVVSPPHFQHAAFHPIVILLKRVVRGPLFHPIIISICFLLPLCISSLLFDASEWKSSWDVLIPNGSDETDVLGN